MCRLNLQYFSLLFYKYGNCTRFIKTNEVCVLALCPGKGASKNSEMSAIKKSNTIQNPRKHKSHHELPKIK